MTQNTQNINWLLFNPRPKHKHGLSWQVVFHGSVLSRAQGLMQPKDQMSKASMGESVFQFKTGCHLEYRICIIKCTVPLKKFT